jgi:hypothetical protein
MTLYKAISFSKLITLLGFLGLAGGFFHLFLPHFSEGHESSFDLAYYAANATMFFVSLLAFQIAAALNALDKRLKSLEGQKQDTP